MRISRSTLATAGVSGGLAILLAGGAAGAAAQATVPATAAHPSVAVVGVPAQRLVAQPAPGVPQGNGGDQDADNNGGPDDGDGNI